MKRALACAPLALLLLGCGTTSSSVGPRDAAGAGGAAGGGGGATGSGGGGTGGADAALQGDASAGDATDAAPPVDRTAVLALMRRVADYELARFGTGANALWVRSVFYAGLMALWRAGNDTKYLAAAQTWGQANAWALGTDTNGRPLTPADNSRFADNQACVQTYAELYLIAPAPQILAAAETAFDKMMAMPVAGRTEWWWCDALFMAPAAIARVAQAASRPQYLDLVDRLFWDTKAYLFSPANHLFWRDDTFLNTGTFWSRGNGWVVGGLARILDVWPAGDARRAQYEALLREMAGELRTIQASDGFWRSDLLNPDAFPNPESSGTAFFTFGLAWGINHGVLDRATYLDAAVRGWTALTSAVDAQGRLGYVQPVGARPGPAAATDTNDYATGALMLAGAEMLEL